MTLKIDKTNPVKILIILLFAVGLTRCHSADKKKSKIHSSDNVEEGKPNEVNEIDEGIYPDSMVNQMIKMHSQKEEIVIDTFKTLHEINCSYELNLKQYKFTMDSVIKFKNRNELGSKELMLLADVSNCFAKWFSTDKFNTFIFYSDNVESHSAESFSILVIDKLLNSFEKLVLAQEYGNESGDFVISSIVKRDSTIERVINHNVRYIPGVGKVDSIYQILELYQLTEDGRFELKFEQVQKSNQINTVFKHL